jgi:hypothetical protein
VDIEYFVTRSRLSTEGLFGLIGTDDEAVIGLLRTLAKGDCIASGLIGVFTQRELAQLGGTAIDVSKQSLALLVLDVLSGIAMTGIGSHDKTVGAFRKTIVTLILPIAEKKGHPGRDLALVTMRAFVH